jgi:hypothetical protein
MTHDEAESITGDTRETQVETTNGYVCPFCGFTAGLRVTSNAATDDADIVSVVRCLSCSRQSVVPLLTRQRQ